MSRLLPHRAPYFRKGTPADPSSGPLLGVFHAPRHPVAGEAGEIVSADRRHRQPLPVAAGGQSGAMPGELVIAEPIVRPGFGHRRVRVAERLGRFDGVRSLSLIAVRSLEIPENFSAEALQEAAAAGPVDPAGREDLRLLPFVTIDGDDARDFDDAIFAEPEGHGFRIIIAIADVAHYVPSGSALDVAARERGNSVYLPAATLPMLPPALSEHWCSLRPGVDRGVLFAEICIGPEGEKLRHRFGRGLIRSRARLTYEGVHRAAGRDEGLGLPDGTLRNLYAAWGALARGRARRGPLEIELPERHVLFDQAGRITRVVAAARFPTHRLIEDFMILANVAAAEEMRARKLPGLYRVHPRPTREKLAALQTSLGALGVRIPLSGKGCAADLTAALAPLAGSPAQAIASQRLLASLPEAYYSAENGGHFGLALRAYAHFTSPIRRYADLLVHRALISGLGLSGPDPEPGAAPALALLPLALLAVHLGACERRAVAAERGIVARAQAALLAERIGSIGEARICGVTRALIFVKFDTGGADGIVPVSTLPKDVWHYDGLTESLTGARSGRRLSVGDRIPVCLRSACPVSGRLVFELVPDAGGARLSGRIGGQRRTR